VAPRLISSFGLPVALTTGRLVVWIALYLTRHPIGLVAVATVPTMMLASGLALAGWRRRLASRRASPS
jgi:hypothetical protein